MVVEYHFTSMKAQAEMMDAADVVAVVFQDVAVVDLVAVDEAATLTTTEGMQIRWIVRNRCMSTPRTPQETWR